MQVEKRGNKEKEKNVAVLHPHLFDKCISNCLNTQETSDFFYYLDTPQTGYELTTVEILSFVLSASAPRIFTSN